MKTLQNKAEACDALMDMPLAPRRPTSATDFGDPGTIGLHVKKVGVDIFEEEDCLGRFIRIGGKPAVLITTTFFEYSKTEVFDNDEEMLNRWQLD